MLSGSIESSRTISMEGNGDEPETIDVLELMKDLDEDENFPSLKQPSAVSSSRQMAPSTKFSFDTFTLEPSDVKEVPRWLSSFRTHGILGRSIASPAEGSSRDVRTYGKAQSKHGSIGGSTSHTSHPMLNVKVKRPTQETLAEHLQRSVSFETPPKKEMKRVFGQKDAMDACHSKGLKMGFNTDASSFSSSRFPWESESVSSPSTPSFSGSVSLKKRFQEDVRRSKNWPEQRAASLGHETSKLLPKQMSPPLARAPKVLGPMSKSPARSQNMGSDVDADANHKSESPHGGAQRMLPVGHNQNREVSQQGHVRRVRHSFTGGNRNKELTEARNSPANNRSSSLESERVAVVQKIRTVLYSTSSKADAHAFEDSNAARAILTSIVGGTFEEKSISKAEYEQELKSALNTQSALVPTVCVKGRYITGLDNIMQLYKKGLLRSLLLESMAQELKSINAPCICRGGKFLICPVCKGKRKLVRKEGDEDAVCRHCSATGLIKCPNCLNL